MSTKAESEITLFKSSLEKALTDDRQAEILDILTALNNTIITLDILSSTMIGRTLSNVKKKYSGDEIGDKAKNLIDKWKKSAITEKAAPKKLNISVDDKHSNYLSSSRQAGSPRYSSENVDVSSLIIQLPDSRIKIIELIASHLKHNTDDENSKFLSYCIENAVNTVYDYENDKKEYKDKLKSLAFNLKQNEVTIVCVFKFFLIFVI